MSLRLYSLAWLSLQTKVWRHPQLVSWAGEKGNYVVMALQRGRRSGLTVRGRRWCWPPNALKDWQGQVKKTSKVLEEIIFLVFVTNSDGMLWWHTSEKEGPNDLKTDLQSTYRDLPYQLRADCLCSEHRWMQWLSSTAAARRGGEQPL